MEWLSKLFSSDETINLTQEAEKLIELENYDEALLKIRLAMAIKPNYPDLYIVQAFCYYLQKRYNSAFYSLDYALRLDNNHKDAWYYLGLLKFSLKNYPEAIECFRKAIQNGYQKADVYNYLGKIFFRTNQTEKAIAQYNLAISKDSESIESYKSLANIYHETEQYQDSVNLCKKALLINPDNLELYSLLADNCLITGDYESALKCLFKALELDNKNISVLHKIVDCYFKTENYQQSINYLNQLIEIKTFRDYELLKWLADINHQAGNINSAINLYQELLDVIGNSAIILFQLGKCYLTDSCFDEELATKYFINAQELDSQNPEILYYLGLAYLQNNNFKNSSQYENTNQFETSLNYFQKYVSMVSEKDISSDKYQNIGINYLKLEQPEKAEEYFKKALSLIDTSKNLSETTELNYLLEQCHDITNKIGLPEKKAGISKIFNLALQLQKRLEKHPSFFDLKNKVIEIIADFDKPLIVTVIGEFKVGKSTFINALIGKEIAPMGVTPTTATINFFQYGSRNRIRINWTDDTEADMVRIDKLAEYVDERKVNKAEAEKIKLVEIFYDWEELRNINVVDTPGLNVGIKRHEETTMNFIEKADALIWLFDVEQAGKNSEKKIFEYIKQFSKKSVAVINGIDKVEPDEFVEVKDYLEEEFNSYFSGFIGVSAKTALKGKINQDNNLIEKSGFNQLESFLNNQVYSKSEEIKAQSVKNKLCLINEQINIIILNYKSKYNNNLTTLEKLSHEINQVKVSFNLLLNDLTTYLRNNFISLYEKIAQEVKEFVNPTKGIFETVFGTNKFTAEDKKFIDKLVKDEVKNLLNGQLLIIEEKVATIKNNIIQILNQLNIADKSNKYSDYFLIFHETNTKDLNSNVIFPNYRYFQGFIDAGILNKYFDEVAYETDLSVNKLAGLASKYLPDIIPSVKDSLNQWCNQYNYFLNKLQSDIEKTIKTDYLEEYQSIYRPVEKLIQEISNI